MRLTLYVVGDGEPSRRTERRLLDVLSGFGGDAFELELVDVSEDPARAEDDRILACPTLVRHTPLPMRRLVGDLSSRELVREALLH